MCTRRQIPDKKRKKYRWLSVFLTVSTVLCLLATYIYQKKLSDFSNIITIEAAENGFQQTSIETFSFTAWTERKDQPVEAEFSGRQTTADCYLLMGDSYLVLPWGKNLSADDTEGCIIGAAVAQTIFGGTEVEGQTLLYDERTLTVRGVVQEPDDILLCQMQEQTGIGSGTDSDSAVTFDRINLLVTEESGTASQTVEQFINCYGLDTDSLHFERKQNLSWLTELIPGKWSNFSGWSTNLKTLQSDRQRLRQCEKSGIESLYMGWVDRRNIFLSVAALMIICQIICLLRAIPKKHLYSES